MQRPRGRKYKARVELKAQLGAEAGRAGQTLVWIGTLTFQATESRNNF